MPSKWRTLLVIGSIFILTSVAVVRGQEHRNTSSVDLAFFRMIDDKTTYEKARDKFELVTASGRQGRYQIIVERVASLRIPTKDIRSVRVRKQKTYSGESSPTEMAKDFSESIRGKKPSDEVFPHGFVYQVTFVLNESIGISFSAFANDHERQRFDLRLGNNRLGSVQFIGRFETRPGRPHESTTFLETNKLEKVKQILAPLKDKITWE